MLIFLADVGLDQLLPQIKKKKITYQFENNTSQ